MPLFALALFQASGFGGLGFILPLALIGFMLLTIIPQQRKQKAWNEMLGKIKPGDRVTTNGGLRGQIVSLRDDAVIIRVQPDGVKLEFVKTAIASVTTEGDEAA